MPLYEYLCRTCGRESEVLVRGAETPLCEHCESPHLERLMSAPRVAKRASANAECQNLSSACESSPGCGTHRCPMQ